MAMFFRREPKLTTQVAVGLTEVGKRTAEKSLTSGPEFAIMSLLNEHSPRSIGEIAEELDMNADEVKERIRRMMKQGYVRISGAEVYG